MSDDFYVNYLTPSPGTRRFVWALGIAAMLLTVVAASLLAGLQRPTGDGRWDTDQPRTFTGVLLAQPYAAIATEDGVHLLVSEGKHGAAELTKSAAEKTVSVRGNLIEREGRRIIEVIDEPVAAGNTSAAASAPPITAPAQTTQLVGEIIDPKCYLGVMKPGEGKPHKACAALCLRGGIPPMFVALVGGEKQYWLLVNADGGPVKADELETLIHHVGDKVSIDGAAGRWAGGETLHIQSITRVQP